MDNSENNIRTEKTFFPNGQIESEIPYEGSEINGTVKRWYANGVLQSETQEIRSVKHGLFQDWNEDGRLYSECLYNHGAGVFKTFYSNAKLKTEIGVRNNVPHGRLRSWDEVGVLMVQKFYINGKAIGKKRYEKATHDDPTLPRYDDDGQISWEEENKHLLQAEQEAFQARQPRTDHKADQVFFDELLASGKHYEVLAWLKEDTSDEYLRTLGEGMSNTDSIEFINQLYTAGAAEVIAVEIEVEPEGFEYTGKLVIKLDKKSESRKKVFKICNPIETETGLFPTKDRGQEYLFLTLD